MAAKKRNYLKIAIPILIAVLFGWFTFSQLPVNQIIPQFKSANYTWVLFGVLLGFLSHLSRAYRWRYLLEPLGYNIKLPNSFMAVFVAYGANYLIPRSGEVLRAVVASNYEDIPFEKGFGTIVAERLADMVVLFGIIGITLVIEYDFIMNLLTRNLDPTKLILFGAVFIILIVLALWFLSRSNSKIAVKIKEFIKGLVAGVTSIFKMKHKWPFIFHTLFIWLMYLLMFYVTTFSLEGLNSIGIGAVLIGFITGSFSIAATNGGIFVYPAAILAAFSLFGIPEDPSFAFGWIMWTSQTIMVIILGLFSFIFLPIYNKGKRKTKAVI